MSCIVKVFKSTGNELPVASTPFSGAKDIRAELNLVKEKFIFGGEQVYVRNHTETGLCPTTVLGNQIIQDWVNEPLNDYPKKAVMLNPGGRVLIPSGLQIELPSYHSMDVRPRSGLALKYGITCLNTPGLIDEDYRGDVGVILINNGFDPVVIVDGDRIAQIKVNQDVIWDWMEVDSEDSLTVTTRGDGGFNSSGTK